MTELTIGPITRTEIVTLTPDMPIRRAVSLLVDHNEPAAPVITEDGRLTGILTQKDCFRPALHASYYQDWSGRVAEHMTSDVVWISAQLNIIQAAEMFLSSPHRVFPVLDDTTLIGLLHRSDVLALLSRNG